jgi:hypothetical protein
MAAPTKSPADIGFIPREGVLLKAGKTKPRPTLLKTSCGATLIAVSSSSPRIHLTKPHLIELSGIPKCLEELAASTSIPLVASSVHIQPVFIHPTLQHQKGFFEGSAEIGEFVKRGRFNTAGVEMPSYESVALS